MAEAVDDVTRRLLGWLAPHLGLPVGLTPCVEGDGAVLELAHVAPAARPRVADDPLLLSLRYRVTLRAADPLTVHRVLGEVAFAAILHPDYEVASPEGAAPGTLIISTTLSRAREARRAPPVRAPLRVVAIDASHDVAEA